MLGDELWGGEVRLGACSTGSEEGQTEGIPGLLLLGMAIATGKTALQTKGDQDLLCKEPLEGSQGAQGSLMFSTVDTVPEALRWRAKPYVAIVLSIQIVEEGDHPLAIHC